ncbi:hypothetical protein PC116_g20654, partial [Phytophthora cactorum]
LEFFGENVDHLAKPVVLIVDNSSTHVDAEAAETCVEYGGRQRGRARRIPKHWWLCSLILSVLRETQYKASLQR